ncbi:two-component sensor histidine kinase [Georgenia sp. 311]|uniref:sensor histidine kinase n=1 Tax=Georgenia sp. 311 TaxID=2585134 RepID=UPI0011125B35|nr:histidine kinase [Georgenia sp. 311]TNC20961.1 two-component sensor histidine kinase [Georgenia sp. 311]
MQLAAPSPPASRRGAGPAGASPALSPPGPPALRPWSRTWRYLAAAGIAFLMWIFTSVDLLPQEGAVPTEVEARMGVALLLDGLLGIFALLLLPLRRRYPAVIGVVTGLLTGVSTAALGAAAVAAVSAATWRRWRLVLPVVLAWVAATVVYEGLWRPSLLEDTSTTAFVILSSSIAVGVVATCIATGFYVGARRELLSTLRQRAETAEREQALKAEAAREAERTRIAREMHDVLAHRISLVAMHAGALAYRTDLSREETAEAAGVIQHNAHLALSELRQVLGVLRAGSPGEHVAPEPPQPELAQVTELVAAASPHVDVTVDAAGLPEGRLPARELPATTSRTAYRVVQEALTNASKHAPGSAVVVRLAGAPGGLLTVEVVNGPPSRTAPGTPGAGLGLLGLGERVELAGGALEHDAGPDGSFTVRAWLPWEEST